VLWVRLPTFYCFEAELSGLSMADTILNCSDLSDYLGAYSIGATTPTENRMIEALLAECPEAQQELREYMAVREALTHMPITNELDDIDLPPLNLPAMTPVAVASETHTHTHSHTPTVQRTITQTQPIPRHHHKDETDPIAKLQLTQPPASRQETPTTESKTRRFPAAVWYAFGSVAAALILVVGMGTFATQLIDEMQSERDALFTLVATESARETTIINVQPTPVDQAVSSVSNGGTFPAEEAVHVHLTPAVENLPDGEAQVIWDSESQVGTLLVENMPNPGAGHQYQMWLVGEDSTISAGTFTVDESGTGVLVFRSPEPLQRFDVIGVSVEPNAGSEAPTTPHLITGEIDT
jgi:hypothetical protein